MTQSSPTVVSPVTTLNGWITVSRPTCTSASTKVVLGSVMVTPSCISRSRIRRRIAASACASCRRSLMPRISIGSETAIVLTLPLISFTRSVR